MTHYQVLGVPPQASSAEIRRAYLALARRHHPDFHTTSAASTRHTAEREMQRINEAWLVLGDARRREEYDDLLSYGTTGSTDRNADRAGQWTPPSNDPRWKPGSGTAHPDFVAVDDEDEFEDEEARQRWLESLDDSPIGNARPIARWQQVLPVVLLGMAMFTFFAGLVGKWSSLLGLGVILFVGSGVAFVLIPMVAVMRSYEREPDR